MSLEEQVIQAVARGWCHPDNSDKVMDVDLAKAIAAEVVKSFSPAPPENNVRAMPDDVGVTDAARKAERQELMDLIAKLCEAYGAAAFRQAMCGLIPEGTLPMEAADAR